jgi:hypothetical protein
MWIPKSVTALIQRGLRSCGYELRTLTQPTSFEMLMNELDPGFRAIYRNHLNVDGFDITQFTTYKIVEHLVKNRVPGDFVECGVYRGRMVRVMIHTLQQLGISDRSIYLYDTFAGMTQPTTDDYRGVPEDAEVVLAKWERGRQPDGINRWNHATLDEVRDGLHQTGYPPERVRFVPGDVLETVTPNSHDRIAFLRLDTDWHASTKHELECLYGRLVVGGVLVIDDYGRWRGSRKATDEFLETLGSDAPLLVRTSGERVCVKLR